MVVHSFNKYSLCQVPVRVEVALSVYRPGWPWDPEPLAGSSSLLGLSHLSLTPQPPRNRLGFPLCPVWVTSLFYGRGRGLA